MLTSVQRPHRMLALAALAAAAIALGSVHRAGGDVLPAPVLTSPIVATIATHEITLTGQHLGLPVSSRELRLESSEGTIVIPSSSPLVTSWGPSSITVHLPQEARSGSVRVVVDGQASNPAELLVYEYSHSALPGPIGHPLHLAVGGDGRLWINEEFQSQLKAATPDETPAYQTYSIPQVAGAGIFAAVQNGVDVRSRINILGEDIDVQPDGSIWFTQGGAYLYAGGGNWNTSRIMRFDPVNVSYRCYVAARDDAEVTSVVVDQARGMVWYLEAEIFEGSAVSGFSLSNTPSDCNFNPETSARPPLCSEAPQAYGCHVRFPLGTNRGPIQMALDAGGDLWVSGYWSNRIFRLDPDTGAVTELPLPTPRVTTGPGAMVGAGPHNMEFDADGNLWITEEFDATISLVRPSLMATNNCTALNALGQNPCIEEVFVGTTGADGQNIHSLDVGANGLVWFTYNGQTTSVLINDTGGNGPDPQIGFVDTNYGNAVVLLPPLEGVRSNGGIVEDPTSGEIWFAEYFERNIGRLQLAGEDGDGVPGASDNCPTAYNPSQSNADGETVDQTPPLGVDDGSRAYSDTAGDACDPDDDNDGIPDGDEPSSLLGGGCAAASGGLNPAHPDSDGDGYRDGAECAIGTDPASSASKPSAEQCRVLAGAATVPTDTDGDLIQDRIEVCGYGTSTTAVESDGDGAKDQCEIASLNTLPAVNSLDQLLLAQAIILDLGGPFVWNADLNKDGANNSADQLLMAQIILSTPGC